MFYERYVVCSYIIYHINIIILILIIIIIATIQLPINYVSYNFDYYNDIASINSKDNDDDAGDDDDADDDDD